MTDFRKELMNRKAPSFGDQIRTITAKQWLWMLPRIVILGPIYVVYRTLQVAGDYLEFVFDALDERMHG